jgi:hypothetical protein
MFEFKKVHFDLSETDWMPQMENWIPILGVTVEHDETRGKTSVKDLEKNIVFETEYDFVHYPGSDQTNYRNQWLLKFREESRGLHMGLTGFSFSDELEGYDHRFKEIDERLFPKEETDENPDFVLKFSEEDVMRFYKNLN